MSNNLSSINISELVCTRISHDLIGNIGAVSNAVELLEEDGPESLGDVMPILELSSKVLSARLQFFRMAFGLNNTLIKDVDKIKDIASNYIQTIGNSNYPINLSLNIKTPEFYKIILLGVMSFSTAFIKGGNMEVTETTQGLSFVAKTDNKLSISNLNAIQIVLNGNIYEENPSQTAPIAYLKSLLEKTGVNICLEFSEQTAVLKIG